MMAEKAKLFGDEEVWRQIMQTDDPKAHKKLGRSVRGYHQGMWDEQKKSIVTRGSYAKFTQNPDMGQHLLDTGEKVRAFTAKNCRRCFLSAAKVTLVVSVVPETFR